MNGQRNLTNAGDIFGKLVVLKTWTGKFGKHKSKETICKCKCECGNVIVKPARYLRHKPRGTKSCGCLKITYNKDHPNWKGVGEISGDFWGKIKKGKHRKGRELDFTITKEYGWKLYKHQGGKCALTGSPIFFPKRSRKFGLTDNAPSLDRIDSSKGYIPGNVQWVRQEINQIKWTLSQQKFINLCCLVAANQNIIVSEALARAA